MARLEYGYSSLPNTARFHEHVRTLTETQRGFVNLLNEWRENPRNLFVSVSGGPGSGKTHTVVKTLRLVEDLRKLYMAPTAILASAIGGQTLHSALRLAWNPDSPLKRIEESLTHVEDVASCLEMSHSLREEMQCRRSDADVVVVDEVGMLPFWLLYQVVRKFFDDAVKKKKKSVLFVGMGDQHQLKPVTSSFNVFQAPFDEYFETVHLRMTTSMRFTPEYDDVVEGLKSLMQRTAGGDDDETDDIVRFLEQHYPVRADLTDGLLSEANRVMAHKNETVDRCNDYYIDEIMKREKLFILYRYENHRIQKDNPTRLRRNCKVVVTENQQSGWPQVHNGTVLTFSDYNRYEDTVVCLDDESRMVTLKRSPYTGKFPLVPGFATTVHKFQGQTVDDRNIVFVFDRCRDFHLVYTALTRVRSLSQISAVIL